MRDFWVRAVAVTGAVVLSGIASAQESGNRSVYTDLDLAKCREVPPDPNDPLQSGEWHCAGYGGIDVQVMEGDLRYMLSYGPEAESEMVVGQTMPAFNTIGQKLEWRLGPDGIPFATIIRYITDSDGGRDGQTLVVTRLGPGPGMCHVAFIDALANPNANEVAREAADKLARNFNCDGSEPQWFGIHGE